VSSSTTRSRASMLALSKMPLLGDVVVIGIPPSRRCG
jgi:hypothetical protein